MANRYWVGGSGTWNTSTTNWSTTSGGASGASAPSNIDNAYFDANSFSGASQVVTVSAGSTCLDMDWTGATNNPTFASTGDINISGSLTFISAMSVTGSNSLNMIATSGTKSINTAGITIARGLIINGLGGTFNLASNFTTTANISLNKGTFNLNGYTVNSAGFLTSGTQVRALNCGASIINCSSDWSYSSVTNLTLNAGTSLITMSGNATNFFIGGGLTYNNITFTGSPITIQGSNTFNVLTISAGKTLVLTSGETQTTSNLSSLGTLGNIITIQSTSAGTPTTITKAGGIATFNYCSIKDITATGTAVYNAYNSTNVSGNTGINFLGGDPPAGYTHQVMGQEITKINGVTPTKVNGV